MARTVAYMMSRFPKLTETFILYEMVELENLGLHIEVYPLVLQEEPVNHPEAARYVERAHTSPILSLQVLKDQLYWLKKYPAVYLALWWEVLGGNLRSPKFLLRSIAATLLGAHFARQMAGDSVEHIHAHWATHPTLCAFAVHRLTGITYSFTAHAHDLYVERAMLDKKIGEASFVVTISEHNRRFIAEQFGRQIAAKVRVVHCGVDTEVFQASQKAVENERFTIICVGSLEEKKGQRYLVEACHRLVQQGRDFQCLLVGDGPTRTQLEKKIAGLKLSSYVKLLGRQTRQQVSQLLKSADIMTLPSIRLASGKQEGIPVALMEGMAMELPVVASDISGVPELVDDGECGYLVPERDPEALALAITRLYQDPELRRRMGRAGRSKVEAGFNLGRNTKELYRLLVRDWSHQEGEMANEGDESKPALQWQEDKS